MIGVLIIGLGNIGSEYNNKNNKHYKISHLNAIQCSKNFKILGLVDKDLNKLNKYKKIYNIYNNIEKALIELKPSLVIISVNIKNHFKILKKLSNIKILNLFCVKNLLQKI